jgi:hypothetical protein
VEIDRSKVLQIKGIGDIISTFETLPHNHHRYKSSKREGKAPIELLTGEPLEAEWWELLTQRVKSEEAATDHGTLPSKPPLQLMVNDDWHTDRQTMVPGQASVEPPGASENDFRQTDPEAA